MSNNGENFSYHSDSDFSDVDENTNRAPAIPKPAASTGLSLMSFLCSDEQEQQKVLSPRKSYNFLSFADPSPAQTAFSDEKPGLFASCGNQLEQATMNTDEQNEAPADADNLMDKQKEPVLRLIPVSKLQAENMRRSKQQSAQLVTSFEHSKLKGSLLR